MREIGASKRLLRRCQRFETVNYAALQGFSRTRRGARAARLLPEKRGRASKEATHYPDLQGKAKDGSDGTRTRDLRRDRPARRNRLRPATTRNDRLEQAILHRANRL
jgi:hypothetical protein